MKNFLKDYAITDLEIMKQLQEHNKRIKALKEILERYFGFEIPTYVIDDIVENEQYIHFCLIVNLAVVNERLSSENGDILKRGIKEMFGIKNNYEILESDLLFSKCNSRNYM